VRELHAETVAVLDWYNPSLCSRIVPWAYDGAFFRLCVTEVRMVGSYLFVILVII
jgi:hypothetical protein